MNEFEIAKARKTMNEILSAIKEYVEACEDNCGEDDEVNTIPAQELLEKAEELQAWIEKVTK